jgi:hypothetical protein
VVAAVPAQDLEPAGVHPGRADGVLVRLGAAEGVEERVEVARGELGEPQRQARAGLRGRAGVAKIRPSHADFIAATTRGCECPMFTDMSWLLKSRIRCPLAVTMCTPSADTMGSGLTAPVADHE